MILWEKNSLDDREAIFEFLYEFNPLAAEKTDAIIEKKVENLNQQPFMGVEMGQLCQIVVPHIQPLQLGEIKEEVRRQSCQVISVQTQKSYIFRAGLKAFWELN